MSHGVVYVLGGVIVLLVLIGPIVYGAVVGVRRIAGVVASHRAAVRSF